MINTRWQVLAAGGTLIYAALAGLWIAFSDKVLGWLSESMSIYEALSTVKGCFFVLVTSLTLYMVLRRLLKTEFEARTKAEETARQLNEIKAVAEQSGEVLYRYSLDNRFTFVSPQSRELLGYGPEDLGTQWMSLLTDNPINQQAFESSERAIRNGEKQPSYLLEIRKKDGSPVLMEIDEAPLKDAQGKVVGMVGAARDVTHREAAQRALRESEERFRRLAQTISEVFWIADLDLTRMQYISPAYEKIWGRSCESLYENPKSWAEAIHPEDREQATAALCVGRGLRDLTVEYRIIRPDGEERWIQDHAFPLRNDAGDAVGMAGVAKDITEAKLGELALRDSEQRLRGLYDSMSEGLALHEMICDDTGKATDYRIVDVNPAAEELIGISRSRLVGGLASEAFGAGSPPHLDIYAQVAETGKAATFETFFEPADRHFAVSVFSPCQGQFATVFSDITKRKDAERQICILNQVYSLLSHVNEAIVRISDRDTLFRETCRIAVEQGQFSFACIGLLEKPGELIRPVAMFGEKPELETLNASAEAAFCEGGPASLTAREGRGFMIPDITQDERMAAWREAALARGYRSMIALPLKSGVGKVIGVFMACAAVPNFFSALVTESLIEVAAGLSFAMELFERNGEREIERQQLRLQHSALEAAANAIVITDRDGQIEWVNEAFTRLTGYSREETIGRNPRILKSGAHEPEFYQRMWQTVLAGKVWQGTMINKRKDGSHYDEEMIVTPVRDRAGEITHFIAIKQDITERKKLEHQFLRAQRTQSIGLLAGGVAHDLNNVLAPVLMALPLLRNNLPTSQRDHILDTLEQSVRRGANIIQQVLTFARGVEVQRVLVQPRHLLREVAKIAEETFPRDIRVHFTAPANLWPLQGDPTQIHQVLLNLSVNARDAMPEGGRLTFAARNAELDHPLQFMDFEIPPGRYVSLSVSDTGTGIAPEVLDHIFEPFFTTKSAGKGTGLGLSTVLGIVKSHSGLVQVESRARVGSTFTVFLPASLPQSMPAAPATRSLMPQGQGETILVVDDETGILQVTKSILEANGYQVMTARNGAQAIGQFAQPNQPIKAMVTDIMMPHMDGLALTRSLRKTQPDLPIVASTGLMNPPGEEDRAGQLRELGVQHFLHKPFQAEDLLTVLQKVLNPEQEAGPRS
jgi:PAS domain S-box-containing protein